MGAWAEMLVFLAAGGVFGVVAVIVIPAWWRQRPAAKAARRFTRFARSGGGGELADAALSAPDPVFEAEPDDGFFDRLRARFANRFANIGGEQAVRRLILYGGSVGAAIPAVASLWLGWGLGLATAAAVGGGFAVGYVGYLQMKRRWQIAFLDNLADAIDLVIRAVRSGIPVVEAIRAAGQEVNDPVRTEFRRISDSVDVGIDLKDALRAAGMRIRLPDFDFFVITLVIQRETGGQLAETLEGLSNILRRRKELRLKIRAMTAEGRMTAAIVGGMPIAAGGAMYVMDPDHMGRLFEPGTGQTMLYIALGMMALGMAVVHQMTKIKP